jgi:hypothetical protein
MDEIDDFRPYMTGLFEGNDILNTYEDFNFMDDKMYPSNSFEYTVQRLELGVLADVSMDLPSILSNSWVANGDYHPSDMFQRMF